jgi:hypothetical protein
VKEGSEGRKCRKEVKEGRKKYYQGRKEEGRKEEREEGREKGRKRERKEEREEGRNLLTFEVDEGRKEG